LSGLYLTKDMDAAEKDRILEGKLGLGAPGGDVYVLLTAAYDVTCDALLPDIDKDMFIRKCYTVDEAPAADEEARSVQDAYDDIQAFLREKASRPKSYAGTNGD